MIHRLQREQLIPCDPRKAWDFFATPHNLAAITPPRLRFEIVGEIVTPMYAGQLIEYRIGLLPGITTRWLTEITHCETGRYFVDEQRFGPYKLWHHEHHFVSTADGGGTRMIDQISYDVGWGPLGALAHTLWIQRELRAIFDYRAQRIAQLFPTDASTPSASVPPLTSPPV